MSERSSSGISAALALLAIAVVAALGWLVFGAGSKQRVEAVERADPAGSAACDPRLVFAPDPPRAGSELRLSYDHGTPLKYADLKVIGPVYPGVQLADAVHSERAKFAWSVTALQPGEYRFEVWGGNPSAAVATCTKKVP